MGEEGKEGRWLEIAPELDLAIGLRFPTAEAPEDLPGMIKYPAPPGAPMQNFYWPLDAYHPMNIELIVPPAGEKAERCELRFRPPREKHGLRPMILFGRKAEERPFTFKKNPDGKEDYVNLTVRPIEREGAYCREFNPLYIKVGYPISSDEGPKIKFNFYVLNARWQKGVITVTVRELAENDLGKVPDFLK